MPAFVFHRPALPSSIALIIFVIFVVLVGGNAFAREGQEAPAAPNFAAEISSNQLHNWNWLPNTTMTWTVDDPDTGLGVDHTEMAKQDSWRRLEKKVGGTYTTLAKDNDHGYGLRTSARKPAPPYPVSDIDALQALHSPGGTCASSPVEVWWAKAGLNTHANAAANNLYYAVTAVGDDGCESGLSGQVPVLIFLPLARKD